MTEDTKGRDSGRWTAARGSLPSLYSAEAGVDRAPPGGAEVANEAAVEPLPPRPPAPAIQTDHADIHDPPDSPLDGLSHVSGGQDAVQSLDADLDDRRTYQRRPFGETLSVTLSGHEIEVRGVDISRGGIRCQPLPYWTRLGDPVLVRLPAPHFHALGRVVWVRPLEDDADLRTGGIRFTSPLAYL